MRIIPQTFQFVKPFMDKNPVQNVQKCPENVQNIQKKYKKVWIFEQNPGKRFGGLLCIILGGFVLIFVIPRQKRGAPTGRYCTRHH
jgi:hypothetical protein